MNQIPVAILGATGPVGQKLIHLVEAHSKFHLAELVASEKRTGQAYSECGEWREKSILSDRVKNMTLKNWQDVESKYVLSALPSEVAKEAEWELAKAGKHIFSNASAHRMMEQVPLLVPEINLSQLELIQAQQTQGKIVTNPNCSTVFVTLALAPLLHCAKIERVNIVTLQALSGAGYPGVSSFDLLGNVIPNISSEEEKILEETQKILSTPGKKFDPIMSVQVHRVPVIHGHSIALTIDFDQEVPLEAIYDQYGVKNDEYENTYQLHSDDFSPQPARHLADDDMRVHIGRVRHGHNRRQVQLVSLGHNLVRGAAGAALTNLEHSLKFLEY